VNLDAASGGQVRVIAQQRLDGFDIRLFESRVAVDGAGPNALPMSRIAGPALPNHAIHAAMVFSPSSGLCGISPPW